MPKSWAFVQRVDLDAALLVLDALGPVDVGRDVVVGHRDGLLGRAHLAAGHAQALEGLRAGHLVDEVAVDVEEAVPSGASCTRWASQILS